MALEGDREELRVMAASLRRHVEFHGRAGIRLLPRGRGIERKPEETPGEGLLGGLEGNLFSDCAPASQAKSLEELRAAIGDCRRCKLWPGRTHVVFGVGNAKAKLMFIGEAPGADEDRQGEPFVGRAGQLLTDIITKGMKFRREDVYILNTIKCRPPGNRAPLPQEAANCREYLDEQLAIIQPEFICCLGAVAAQNLLGTSTPIGQLRGRFHDFHGIKVLCTYHPAYVRSE